MAKQWMRGLPVEAPPTMLLGIVSNASSIRRRQLLRRTWLPHCRALLGCDAYFILDSAGVAAADRAAADVIVLESAQGGATHARSWLARRHSRRSASSRR